MPVSARLLTAEAPPSLAPAWLPTEQELLARPQAVAFAVDPENPLEVDDAIWTEHRSETEHRVAVFICDIGLIAGETRALDLARARGWTRYARNDHEKDRTMFDESMYVPLGLNQRHYGHGAPAIKIGFSINPLTGTHGEIEFERVCVRTSTYSYEEFNQTSATGDDVAHDLLVTGDAIVHALKIDKSMGSTGGPGQEMIARYMVMTNFIVADAMEAEGMPWLYRNHGVNAVNNIRHISDEHRRLFKRFMRALYQGERIGHAGLGLGAYCHLTSGLRRFPDAANGLNLDAFIDERAPVYSYKDMSKISDEMTEIYRKELIRRTRHRAA